MSKHPVLTIILLIVLLIFAPVLFRQILLPEGRSFSGVQISDLTFDEIEFQNSAKEIDLGGMLFVPSGEGPFPAAVIIHGSGTSSRSNGWYSTMAHDLVQQGIVVLLPDKRGSEKSSGDWRTASFEDLATDTTAAVEYLMNLENPGISRIGVVGMSQGGWIAPITANHSAAIDYVVSFSGATVTPSEQLYFEEVNNLRQLGFLPGVAHVLASLSSRWIINISQSGFWDGIRDFQPAPYWSQLTVDALVVFGEDDTNVPFAASIEEISRFDNPRLQIAVFSGSGHAIEEPIERGSRVIRPEASLAVTDFILGLESVP